jgi:hypothetical protein
MLFALILVSVIAVAATACWLLLRLLWLFTLRLVFGAVSQDCRDEIREVVIRTRHPFTTDLALLRILDAADRDREDGPRQAEHSAE